MKKSIKKSTLFFCCLSIILTACTTKVSVEDDKTTTKNNAITENIIENNETTESTITPTIPESEPDLIEGDYKYKILPDGTAEITKYLGDAEILDIPSGLNGYIVSKLGDFSFAVSVGAKSNLKSVTIPDSVTEIGFSAFSGCEELENIEIPESVTKFNPNLFDDTSFINNHEDDLIIINNHLIKYKGNEESVVIPENVVEIHYMAFFNNSVIKNVTIPDNCIIGEAAFIGCNNLSDITIPDNVDKIGKDAFFATQFLINKLKTDIYVIVNNILIHTEKQFIMRDVEIPESIGIVTIGSGSFNENKELYSVIIPNGVAKIDEKAFFKCTYLKNVTIPDSVTEIEKDAFWDCINLKITCSEGSYAEQYCIENNIEFEIFKLMN